MKKLSEVQGKLAQEITKATYDLGFISLPPDYDEAALEDAEEQIRQRIEQAEEEFRMNERNKLP